MTGVSAWYYSESFSEPCIIVTRFFIRKHGIVATSRRHFVPCGLREEIRSFVRRHPETWSAWAVYRPLVSLSLSRMQRWVHDITSTSFLFASSPVADFPYSTISSSVRFRRRTLFFR